MRCQNCGNEYQPKKATQVYCGAECREKHLAYLKANPQVKNRVGDFADHFHRFNDKDPRPLPKPKPQSRPKPQPRTGVLEARGLAKSPTSRVP